MAKRKEKLDEDVVRRGVMEAISMADAYKFVLIEFFFVAIFVGEYFHSWIMFAVALVVMAILWVAAIGVPPLTKPILIGISAFLGIWGWRFGSNWGLSASIILAILCFVAALATNFMFLNNYLKDIKEKAENES